MAGRQKVVVEGLVPWGSYIAPRQHADMGYTADEVARAFGVTRQTVYRLAKMSPPKLPSIKFGRRCLRFPKKAIRAMLRAGFNLKID